MCCFRVALLFWLFAFLFVCLAFVCLAFAFLAFACLGFALGAGLLERAVVCVGIHIVHM